MTRLTSNTPWNFNQMPKSSPNLQNVPLHTEVGRAIREAALKELPIFDMDFAEMEERILASMDRRDTL